MMQAGVSAAERAELQKQLENWLRRTGRRIGVRLAVRYLLFALTAWAGLSVVLIVIAHTVPLGWEERAVVLAAPVACAAALVAAGLKRVPLHLAARVADKELNTDDQIATAWQLSAAPDIWALALQQLRRTAGTVLARPAKEAAPIRAPARLIASAALGASIVVAGLLADNPMDRVIRERRAQAAAIQAESRRIHNEASRIRQSAIDPAARQAIVSELERLTQRLEQSRTVEQALKELARTEGALSDIEDRGRLTAKTLSASLDRSVAKDPLLPGSEGTLAEQLEDLARATGPPGDAERAKAAEKLSQIAEVMGPADPALSKALAEAASAMQRGEGGPAAEKAAAAVRKLQENLSADEAAAASRASVARARDRLSQISRQARASGSGQRGTPGGMQRLGPRQTQGQGQGRGPTQGQGQGQGQAQGQGQGQAGGSTGRQGGSGGPDISQAKVYNPVLPGRAEGQLRPEGEIDAAGSQRTVGTQASGAQRDSGIYVPYHQVYGEWSRKAARNVSSMPVPASMRSFVRGYFASLDPAKK